MKIFKTAAYWVMQWTWGILQSMLGFVLFLRYAGCKHEFYHGAVLTYHNGEFGGISLGVFIFVKADGCENWIKDARVHEYGHTVQSLMLGPLYLFVIGIPSSVWCNAKKYIAFRESGKATYYDFYPESGANKLGAYVLKEPVPLWEHNLEEYARRKTAENSDHAD